MSTGRAERGIHHFEAAKKKVGRRRLNVGHGKAKHASALCKTGDPSKVGSEFNEAINDLAEKKDMLSFRFHAEPCSAAARNISR